MNTLQAWLLVGIPLLALTAGLFSGRSPTRAAFGYLALAVALVFFILVPGSTASAAVIGAIAFLLVAAGRGTSAVEQSEDWGQLVPQRMEDEAVDEPRQV